MNKRMLFCLALIIVSSRIVLADEVETHLFDDLNGNGISDSAEQAPNNQATNSSQPGEEAGDQQSSAGAVEDIDLGTTPDEEMPDTSGEVPSDPAGDVPSEPPPES